MHERGGELHALLVAEAELEHVVVAAGGDPQPLQPLLHGGARGAALMPCSRAR